MIENTRLHELGGDAQREQKNSHVIWSRDMITLNPCKSWKGVQSTFLVEMEFWLEGPVARCYGDHVSRRMLGRMGMTLWSLKTYG